jgi:hypothetical protein
MLQPAPRLSLFRAASFASGENEIA